MSTVNPRVSVLMPVYNAGKVVLEAIQSILNQSFTDFELIIIDDGSDVLTKSLLYSFNDSRIKIIDNQVNRGLIYSLNIGLLHCKGDYVIRMDSDDISYLNRFDRQVKFMDQNPFVVASGAQILYFGDDKISRNRNFIAPTTHKGVINRMFVSSAIAHPTAIIRNSVIVDNKLSYNVNYKDGEDYKLWLDLSKYGELRNINDVLLKYRVSSSQISQTNTINMNKVRQKIQKEHFSIVFQDVENSKSSLLDKIVKCKKYPSYGVYCLKRCNHNEYSDRYLYLVLVLVLGSKIEKLMAIKSFIYSSNNTND